MKDTLMFAINIVISCVITVTLGMLECERFSF